MPPLPNGNFGDDVEMHRSSYLQEHSLIILRIVLPSIGIGLLMLFAVIVVLVKCRLCCRHRGDEMHQPSTANGEKCAQLENGGGNEEKRKRYKSSDSSSRLLHCTVEPTIHEADEEAEQVEGENGVREPIYIHVTRSSLVKY